MRLNLRSLSRSVSRRSIKRGRSPKRLRVESLESRRVLTTFFVDGAAADGGDGSEASPFNTIQAAAVAAATADGGDTISLSPGDYVENVTIEDSGDLTILGNGSTVESAGAEDHTIDIDESGNIAIHDLTISGADEDGLHVRDSTSLTLNHVTLKNNGDEGLDSDGVDDISLSHVNVASNDGRGIQIEDADDISIDHATIHGNGHRGIEIESAGDVELSKLNISGDGTRDGVKVEDADNLTVSDSRFIGNDDGLDLELIAGAIVIDHVVANGNSDEGLEVDDSGSITVTNSVFKNNFEAGLDMDDVGSVFVDRVTATHNGEHGLQIESEDDEDEFSVIASVVISNSVFSNNVGDGIQIVAQGEATVESVAIISVRANSNTTYVDEDTMILLGGHGLFIEIGGVLTLDKVNTRNNPRGNVLPPV